MTVFLTYLATVNGVAMAVCGWDKFCAIRHRWRVPERTLLLLAALGGSVGMLAGMILFHHKASKKKFILGVPLILALQVAAAWVLTQKINP